MLFVQLLALGSVKEGNWFTSEREWTVDYTNYDYSKVTIPCDMSATEKAVETFGKYFGRIKGREKNYIFSMGIRRDCTKSGVVPEIKRGKNAALPLETEKGVTVTDVWIDLNANGITDKNEKPAIKGKKIKIPKNATTGETTALAKFDDGTEIIFNIDIID